MRLEDQSGIDSFSRERGLPPLFLGDHVEALWNIGFIRADLIESTTPLLNGGLSLLGEQDGTLYYSDHRTLQPRHTGWVDAIHSFPPFPERVRLLFHPFRYYVLWHIQRVLDMPIARLQPLFSSSSHHRLLDDGFKSLARFSATSQFAENVNSWNTVAEFAIAAEPCFYQLLFGRLSHPHYIAYEDQLQLIAQHWEDIQPWFLQLGVDALEQHRRDLCIAAESLDPNKDVHTLLRLATSDRRIRNVKGRLGGSMVLLAMAETLRRAGERTFELTLPEEDELGFGLMPKGVKRDIYGSDRLLDASSSVKAEWLRGFGLGSGLRLRWYVEGDTEYNALDSIIGRYPAIVLVNLRGHVAARSSKGVAFRDSLRSDDKSLLFSFISIDGDRPDFIRVVRKAAEDDDFCGMFFISEPDFEFQNFTIDEIEEILWACLSEEHELADTDRQRLHDAIHATSNAAQLFASLADAFPNHPVPHKGAEWGRRLMQYAWEHPDLPAEEGHTPHRRQVVEALEHALRCAVLEFGPSRRGLRVDPSTGRPVSRHGQHMNRSGT
jgi:hypothetical protein